MKRKNNINFVINKSIRATVFTIAFLFSFSSYVNNVFASNGPIKVDAQGDHLRASSISIPVWRYTITSVEDNVVIKSLVLNRGNCVISTADRGHNVNQQLGFGQSYTFTSPTSDSFTRCKPLELIVNTDKGSYTFTW